MTQLENRLMNLIGVYCDSFNILKYDFTDIPVLINGHGIYVEDNTHAGPRFIQFDIFDSVQMKFYFEIFLKRINAELGIVPIIYYYEKQSNGYVLSLRTECGTFTSSAFKNIAECYIDIIIGMCN